MTGKVSFSRGGLRTKLMAGACLMAVIPLIVLGTISVYNSKSNIENEVEGQVLMISKSLADMVDGIMTSESAAIDMLAQRDAVIQAVKEVNAGGSAQKVSFLQKELAKLQQITGSRYDFIFIAGKNGIVFTDSVNGETKGMDISGRDYFKKAIEGHASFDSVVISKKSNEPVCSIVFPVKDENNRTIGVIAGIMKISFLATKVKEIKLGKTGYAYLADKDGTVIVYPPDPKQVLTLTMIQPGMETATKRTLAGETGIEKYTFKGVYKYSGFAPITINGWHVVTSVPVDEMLKSVYAIRNIIILGVVIFAIIAIVIAYFVAKGIAVPIQIAVEKIGTGSNQITGASGEVASASQSLAEGSSQQASAIEETSSSLEEMASMTKQNAGNAGLADSLMKQANEVVQKANTSMASLTSSMKEISAASEETSKIIKTIDEIAFQTNLLALNAAVEAARAGEAGAGFAVVAEEVRNLAMRSADAAKNTSGLIEGIVNKIKDGSDLVTKTNEAFVEVAGSTSKVAELVGEIAAASQEQAQGIDQINKAVAEMDKVTQQTAANAEESASASEELNSQAETMREVVQELLQVIDGGSSNGIRSDNRADNFPMKKKVRSALTAVTGGKGTGRSVVAYKKSEKVDPEQIIPMDDGVFKYF
ncbi:MAG: methyl-accepting chemotaxis protein [Smithella sp.]